MSLAILVEFRPGLFESADLFTGEEAKFAGTLVHVGEVLVDNGEKLEGQCIHLEDR
jgi:hypothetical protein